MRFIPGPASALTGSETTATVATDSLTAGTYTVKGAVKEGKPGKEGQNQWETAECSAIFTVKPFEPPTISCTANPTTIKPGDTSTITAAAVSPQNRPLTYSYSAIGRHRSGSGATAEFNSAGAPTGAVGITCNVADDKGGSATANTIVTIVAPYVAPVPHTQALCSLSFEKNRLHADAGGQRSQGLPGRSRARPAEAAGCESCCCGRGDRQGEDPKERTQALL